jgi:hypothetical protein
MQNFKIHPLPQGDNDQSRAITGPAHLENQDFNVQCILRKNNCFSIDPFDFEKNHRLVEQLVSNFSECHGSGNRPGCFSFK